jgi:exonuclease III
VRVRVDRAIASPSWSQWFLDVKVQHLVSSRSNHCPVFLDLEKRTQSAAEATIVYV